MVYGIARERFDEETFKRVDDDLNFAVLEATDPEAAQDELNRRAMLD